jgi:mRNA interferase MazF
MFQRGELVLIPFPFSDLSAAKKRPVLLLTAPDGYGDFIALAVTSRRQIDNAIALDPKDLVQRRLPLASWVRTDRVVTLNASLVVRGFGRVSEAVMEAALARLCAFVGHLELPLAELYEGIVFEAEQDVDRPPDGER